jgi:DNA-binding NarL/FixJ family response regulator
VVFDDSWQRFWLSDLAGRWGDERARVSVLVAHDNLLYAEALILCIEIDERLEVVAHAGDGWEVLELAAGFRPDVVLAHADLPGLDGIEITLRLRHICPEARVVIIGGATAASELGSTSESGVSVRIGKDCSIHRLLSTLVEVAGSVSDGNSGRPVRRA